MKPFSHFKGEETKIQGNLRTVQTRKLDPQFSVLCPDTQNTHKAWFKERKKENFGWDFNIIWALLSIIFSNNFGSINTYLLIIYQVTSDQDTTELFLALSEFLTRGGY